MAGLEVEEAERAAPPFTNVVVGRITAIAPHPNADRLRVCTVDAGGAEPLSIVCGAPNAAAGLTVPCALEGAVLPGGMAIKRATMRGVESRGMLCSAKELGIDEDASGLLVLDSALKPGTSVRDALALDDTLVTLKITPNRADCLSIADSRRTSPRSPVRRSHCRRSLQRPSPSTACAPCASTPRTAVRASWDGSSTASIPPRPHRAGWCSASRAPASAPSRRWSTSPTT